MEQAMISPLRHFLEIPYEQLEEMNLEAKNERLQRVDPDSIREKRLRYLTDEKGIKALTVCFTDLEGRMHMLDYDKKFLLGSYDNLTFDGSSIRGTWIERDLTANRPIEGSWLADKRSRGSATR